MKTLKIISIIALSLVICNCEDALDKTNLEQITPDQIWNSRLTADAYLNNLYAYSIPGWPRGQGEFTDESDQGQDGMHDWLRGTVTPETYHIASHLSWSYGTIRNVNFLFENIETGTLSIKDKKEVKGQAFFIRAYLYNLMVTLYGGVPLITKTQNREDSIFTPRSKTSECFAQIESDLDSAIEYLPKTWSGANLGRIDKCAAIAFKGRVTLFHASPQFTPTANAERWEKAYQVNKNAIDTLNSAGKGLYEDFSKIWTDEMNKEAIMVQRFDYPGNPWNQACIRPLKFSQGGTHENQATLQLVNAFPMDDGSEFKPVINGKENYDTLFRHRDKRFYATIGYNGSKVQLKDMVQQGTYLWTYLPKGIYELGEWDNYTSFYGIKGWDMNITRETVLQASVDWIEIRYAEVLMNYGEAANETARTAEAIEVLKKIRKRAGIIPGNDGLFGLKVANQSEIREAYMKERFVEFAFEGKRYWDIRRLRRIDILNNLRFRTGLKIVPKKVNNKYVTIGPLDDINSDQVWTKFTSKVMRMDIPTFNVKEEYYFYPFPTWVIDSNSKLQQPIGWGGTFDPLQ